MTSLPRSTPAVILGVAVLMLLTTTGGAVAGSLITGKQIKDGTITSADIKNKTIKVKDLAPSARGRTGPTGATGAQGVPGARGFSAWDVIPSGTTVVGEATWDGSTTGSAATDGFIVSLPGVAPAPLTDDTVNFQAALEVVDADAACTGTVAGPTAPPGKVCLYRAASGQAVNIAGYASSLASNSFRVYFTPSTDTPGMDQFVIVSWAYTAP